MIAALLALQIATADAQDDPTLRLDLTAPQPLEQQGIGFPGAMGGGGAGARPQQYEMPLNVEIIDASVLDSGDFAFVIRVENVGESDFEMPVSRNITDVQRTIGSPRHELLFGVRSAGSKEDQRSIVAVTAGSQQVAHSIVRLAPTQAIRVKLRIESSWARNALPKNSKQVQVRLYCGGWILENGRFVIQASAKEVLSKNEAILDFTGGTPTAVISGPTVRGKR